MTLALVYAVTAVPQDIHASTAGATSVVDLHVSIAPPQGATVQRPADRLDAEAPTMLIN